MNTKINGTAEQLLKDKWIKEVYREQLEREGNKFTSESDAIHDLLIALYECVDTLDEQKIDAAAYYLNKAHGLGMVESIDNGLRIRHHKDKKPCRGGQNLFNWFARYTKAYAENLNKKESSLSWHEDDFLFMMNDC